MPDGIWYGRCTPDVIERIIQEHLIHGDIVEEFLIAQAATNPPIAKDRQETEPVFDGTYLFDEFCQHFEELQHGEYFGRDRAKVNSGGEPIEKSAIVVMEYMRERYSDEQEALFKSSCYTMILNFLSHQLHDVDQCEYAANTVGALSSEQLLKAIHHYFTSPELDRPTRRHADTKVTDAG